MAAVPFHAMNSATDRISRKFIGAVEDEWQLYSNNHSDYIIGAPIGFGASSVVYNAKYNPPDASEATPCAIKVLDLDRLPHRSLRLLQRETQLMSLSKHPNVLRVRGTWVEEHKLYIATRLMNAGSALDVMRYGWPGGMQEEVVKCILKQALQGLNYLHTNGLIHRDVKAANLLIDDDGTVLLGDLGAAAPLYDSEDAPSHRRTRSGGMPASSSRHVFSHSSHTSLHPASHPNGQRKAQSISRRKSFVGTPCWMAPEVINGRTYDASADIWSFGITALELTQGRAPRSLLAPHTALLKTVQDAPPTLERSAGEHQYSAAFQELVAACLNKDPSQRPTAAELLATPFFRSAKKHGFLVGAVLRGLPPLAQRQERRRAPSVMSHRTMDSWDFSPAQSVYGHAHGFHPPSVLPENGVFEIEDGAPTPLEPATAKLERRTGAQMYVNCTQAEEGRGRSRPHSRTVSWIDEQPPPISSDSEPEAQALPNKQTADAAATPESTCDTLSASASASSVSSVAPVTPSSSNAAQTPMVPSSSPGSGTGKSTIWRRLTGLVDDSKARDAKESDSSGAEVGRTVKKTLGSMLGRTTSRTVGI